MEYTFTFLSLHHHSIQWRYRVRRSSLSRVVNVPHRSPCWSRTAKAMKCVSTCHTHTSCCPYPYMSHPPSPPTWVRLSICDLTQLYFSQDCIVCICLCIFILRNGRNVLAQSCTVCERFLSPSKLLHNRLWNILTFLPSISGNCCSFYDYFLFSQWVYSGTYTLSLWQAWQRWKVLLNHKQGKIRWNGVPLVAWTLRLWCGTFPSPSCPPCPVRLPRLSVCPHFMFCHFDS